VRSSQQDGFTAYVCEIPGVLAGNPQWAPGARATGINQKYSEDSKKTIYSGTAFKRKMGTTHCAKIIKSVFFRNLKEGTQFPDSIPGDLPRCRPANLFFTKLAVPMLPLE
jgi:hypothetical protein